HSAFTIRGSLTVTSLRGNRPRARRSRTRIHPPRASSSRTVSTIALASLRTQCCHDRGRDSLICATSPYGSSPGVPGTGLRRSSPSLPSRYSSVSAAPRSTQPSRAPPLLILPFRRSYASRNIRAGSDSGTLTISFPVPVARPVLRGAGVFGVVGALLECAPAGACGVIGGGVPVGGVRAGRLLVGGVVPGGAGLLAGASPSAHRAGRAGHAPRVGERPPQQELDLRVGAAQLVRG